MSEWYIVLFITLLIMAASITFLLWKVKYHFEQQKRPPKGSRGREGKRRIDSGASLAPVTAAF